MNQQPAQRRFESHREGGRYVSIDDTHPAYVAGRTIFPTTVRYADEGDRVLKSGFNSRKIGKAIKKGRWKGMLIYTLTLEERATCPRRCPHWDDCMGNKMHRSHRFNPGHELTEAIGVEVVTLADAHPDGFAVRLHVLGDFYNENYVIFWARLLDAFPQLHCFGFTAHDPEHGIGAKIAYMNGFWSDQWDIRFSGLNTEVVDDWAEATGIPCPAQRDDKRYCGNCALCWQTGRKVSFLRH